MRFYDSEIRLWRYYGQIFENASPVLKSSHKKTLEYVELLGNEKGRKRRKVTEQNPHEFMSQILCGVLVTPYQKSHRRYQKLVK